MFTGIVADVGELISIERKGDARFAISTAFPIDEIAMGASVACSGVCLTVVEKRNGSLGFDVSAETLACTTLGEWESGHLVNLERALRMGDELGGHVVSGHVDGLAEIVAIAPEGDSLRFAFAAPARLGRFIAPKGSIALDGVSLTVNEVSDESGRTLFGVNLIPHTQACTSFRNSKPGDRVNLEIDMMARYAARLMETRA